MKKVEAIIRPTKLSDVRKALEDINMNGMTITTILGTGREEGYIQTYRGIEYDVEFLKKMKIEILIDDERCDACVRAIMESARTGEMGDGKIVIHNVEKVISIRTTEEGRDAF